jgi:O-antigen ligase
MMANGESSGFRMLYRLLYPVIAFAYFASNFRKERDIEKVLTSIILIGVAVVTGSIIQYVFFGSGWRISAGVMRYVGLGSASDYAYNMGFLTILCYVRLRSGEVRWVYGALAVLFATGMLLTITRGAIIGTALAVLGYEFFGKHGKLASRLFAASCLIIVLLGTISFYSPLRSRIFAEHYKDIQTKHSMGSYEKFEQGLERSGRPRALRFALREMMGGHHILFGYGIGSAEEDALDALGGLPHNEYVRVFYEMGLLGISIFIASLLQLWLILRRSLLVATTNFQKLVSGIGISLMTLFCAGSMVDNLLSKYKSIGMVLFMIIAFTIVAYKDNSSYAISAKEKALSR